MTYEEFYKPAISDYLKKWNTYYDGISIPGVDGKTVLQLKQQLPTMKQQLAQLEASPPPPFSHDIATALDIHFAEAQRAYDQRIVSTKQQFDSARQAVNAEHDRKIADADAKAEESISSLVRKHQQLLTYKDKVSKVILRYGIKPSDTKLDLDNMSRDELENLLDVAIESCKFLGDDKFQNKLEKLCDPGDDDEDHRLNYAIAIIVCSIFLAPFALVGLFAYLYYKTSKVYKEVDALSIADKLMYEVSFAKYKDNPDYTGIEDVDTTSIDTRESEELARLEKNDPALLREEIQKEINKSSDKISDAYRAASNSIAERHNRLVAALKQQIQLTEKELDDYMNNMKRFGDEASSSYVLDTKFVLGQQDGVLDVSYDMGLSNIVFADHSTEMMLFMKLIFSNMLLKVRPKQLSCTIFDEEGLGADFATFLSKETADYITVVTKDMDKVLEDMRAYSQNNLRILDKTDINTFNKDAEGKGMVTLEYRLLILLTGMKEPLENRKLTEFMQFSGRTGAFVWLVAPKAIENCIFYDKPFANVESPYPISQELFSRVSATYLQAFNTLKDKGILYKPAFADKYLPREKWWKENTDKGIKLNFGLQDGDPSKGYSIDLGDAPVHGLCVGATGAGKSAFNNQLILSLITRYPPSALELVMIDFKNIEFAMLTDSLTHISRIPHARVIAGTKDGEYAISIFDYLMDEMTRRTEVFAQVGKKKLEDYNTLMRSNNQAHKCMPRILVLIDEFQVMFTEVDPKSVDIIQARIRSLSKLARFCGCHLFFTSQSMKGTMPKDILDQFSLRVALRCSSDTSNDTIGSPIASKIKSKFGYLYTNTNMGESQDSTRFWRTPFASDDVIFDTLDAICQMADEKKEINHHAYFYNENEQYSDTHLIDWYKENQELVAEEKRLIILGERTGFTLKSSPANFKLKKGDGENILLYAFEDIDFQNLVMSMITNIRSNPGAKLMVNCADGDMYNILEIEDWYDQNLLETAKPMVDPTEWIDSLEGLIEARKEADPNSYGPLYFLAIRWDKQMGISRNENYKISDRWKDILLNAPTVDIHIIFCAQLYKDIPASTLVTYNHIIAAKGPEDASYKLTGGGRLAKLPDELGFAIYTYGSSSQKFKIYQHEFSRQAESRELKI